MLEFLIQIFVTALIVWLAFWRRDIILYLLATPACITAGLSWGDRYSSNAGLVVATTIIAIGVYTFWKVVENLYEKWVRA